MAIFLWSGKDVGGHARSERVEAENAQEAKQILLGRGWSSLELITDEVCSSEAIRVEANEETLKEFEKYYTADRQAAMFKGKKAPGVFKDRLMGIARRVALGLVFGAILAIGIYAHSTGLIITAAVCIVFMALILIASRLIVSGSANSVREYSRLNTAKVWARWDEVLECVEKLRQPDKITGAAVPEFELSRNRAQALAGLGRLEEGLTEFARYENSPKMEHWLYLSHLAGIYDAGRQFEKGLELRRQAAAEKPDASTVWIDVAYASVRRLNRVAEAREALARAESLEITELGRPYVNFLKGIIAWRERKPSDAKMLLEKAMVGFQPHAHHALMEGLLLLTKSYLCAVRGQLGDTAEAKRLFSEVEEFLAANKEDELLEACRAVVPGRR